MEGQNKRAENGVVEVLIPRVDEGQLFNPGFSFVAEVFGNEFVRETIVNNAIFDQHGYLDRSTAFSLRTLGKGWNASVCKLLKRNGQALFEISLSTHVCLNFKQHGEQCGEFLDKFTKSFGSSSGILGCSPTYNLLLNEKAFHRENYTNLTNFLLGCGQGIVKLAIITDTNGGSLNEIFGNISLPSVQSARFHFGQVNLNTRQGDNITCLLQSIFRGTTTLKELTLENREHGIIFLPSFFQSIVFPPSLEKICIDEFSSVDLEILLVENKFANLSSLTLKLWDDTLTVGLLSRILENARNSLKHFCLDGTMEQDFLWDDSFPETVLFRFPVMEKLETFETSSKNCQLHSGIEALENYLPKLRLLKLEGQSCDMLRKWTTASKLTTVQDLCLKSKTLSFDAGTMKGIHLAFPNVTNLELRFAKMPVSGLEYMFMKMTNLVELKLEIFGSDGNPGRLHWDSVLIGIPGQLTEGLLAPPVLSFWKKIQLNNDEDSSIRKLSALRTFTLLDYTEDGSRKTRVLVTDLTFHFALLRMPQLKKLNFSGTCVISPSMAEKWKRNGGELNYTQ